LPTLFVFEGGYAVAEIGENVANVLRGFEDAAGT
jgi:acetoin utilization deacetylase AcuC-like enzyme